MKQAAVGLRVHSGWAAMVALCVEKGAARVLDRKRVHLVETFTYRFRQPYHTAEKMPIGEAGEFVAGMEKESQKLAYRAIQVMRAELQKQSIELTRCALLLASGRALPSFENILASHALIHTADGELFREALSCAAKRSSVEIIKIKEKELLENGVRVLRIQPAALLRRLTALGKPFGAPWSQDEKFAALAAWLGLRGIAN
jgi:hypothetical protein